MAEYSREQRNQLSKVISISESQDGQLQRFIDNRSQTDSQLNLINSIQKKSYHTGLPDNLKSGIENLSRYSLDYVKVHYNSDKPAQLQALAYVQGTDIHVAPIKEKNLPHEAWHVVQQKQARVQATMQLQGVNVIDNEGLENEADLMEGESKSHNSLEIEAKPFVNHGLNLLVQRFVLPAGQNFNNRQDADISHSKKWELPSRGAIKLHRAHIIPIDTIHQFASIIFKRSQFSNDRWLENSIDKLAQDNDSTFIQDSNGNKIDSEEVKKRIKENTTTGDDLVFIERAISWMPGNIFIAPLPTLRKNDAKNGFETEAEKVVDATKYALLHKTYLAMDNVIKKPTNKMPVRLCADLAKIASWNGPYKFIRKNWGIDKGKYYAK